MDLPLGLLYDMIAVDLIMRDGLTPKGSGGDNEEFWSLMEGM